jgi:hypothetical protein
MLYKLLQLKTKAEPDPSIFLKNFSIKMFIKNKQLGLNILHYS